MEKFKEIVKSDGFKKTLYIILGLLVLLFTFELGMINGFREAYFSDRVGGDYFMEMRGMMNNSFFSGLLPGGFMSPHGAVGKIIGIKLPNITIADRNGNDENVQISSTTEIRDGNNSEKQEDLKIDDIVVIFGAQNDDNPIIDARLIRILPPATSGSDQEDASATQPIK